MPGNTPLSSSTPIVGFAAFSGTGKTTLLEKLIPILVNKGFRVGVIKASHHSVDPDTPGKDSFRLRKAGSIQLVLSTPNRSICYTERDQPSEPKLHEELQLLDHSNLDLVIVEGFRDEPFPKIELHRQSFDRPFLYPEDCNIIAIAHDTPSDSAAIATARAIPQLNLNQPERIADFILEHLVQETAK
jgi:molybdopterin-guanine dinucleotide biosynthesis protein B